MHGAKVGGEGSSGKGSTFYFKIDLAIPTKSEEQTSFLTTEILNVDDMADAEPDSKRSSLKISPGNSSSNLVQDVIRRKSSFTNAQQKKLVFEAVEDLVAEDLQRSKSPGPVSESAHCAEMVDANQKVHDTPQVPTPKQSNHDVVAPTAVPMQSKGGKPTALLVDDVKSNRRMYGRILELLGFEVATAEDGVECLSVVKAATSPFTVILIDHSMVSEDAI